jgi:hypothetical protein
MHGAAGRCVAIDDGRADRRTSQARPLRDSSSTRHFENSTHALAIHLRHTQGGERRFGAAVVSLGRQLVEPVRRGTGVTRGRRHGRTVSCRSAFSRGGRAALRSTPGASRSPRRCKASGRRRYAVPTARRSQSRPRGTGDSAPSRTPGDPPTGTGPSGRTQGGAGRGGPIGREPERFDRPTLRLAGRAASADPSSVPEARSTSADRSETASVRGRLRYNRRVHSALRRCRTRRRNRSRQCFCERRA